MLTIGGCAAPTEGTAVWEAAGPCGQTASPSRWSSSAIAFAAIAARTKIWLAGLLLALPDVVSLDLPGLIAAAGYPGTSVVPAVSWLLSLLALKLTGTLRVSHVDDLLTERHGHEARRPAGSSPLLGTNGA